MNKVSILIPHFRTWKWTAICIWHLKQFGIPVDSEIILCDNSPGHPSIKAITETDLGSGVKVISGMPEFSSHGMGYDLAVRDTEGDWIFTCETDSFPTRSGWFDEYVKASADFDLIGPEIPQSSGRYIHPAGCLYKRDIILSAMEWQRSKDGWVFCPSAAIEFGLSDKAYHVVASEAFLDGRSLSDSTRRQIELWDLAGPFQEMRSFDEDSFDTYPRRTGITNFEPVNGKEAYLKIGYEAGQWLAYFAKHKGYRVLAAPTDIQWMPRHEARQAAHSTVFGGFQHCWCGTVSTLPNDIPGDVRNFKLAQQAEWFSKLPEKLRKEIEALEAANK